MNTTHFGDEDLRRLLEIEADDVVDGAGFATRLVFAPPLAPVRGSSTRRIVAALVAALFIGALATIQIVRDAGPTRAAASLYTFDGAQVAPALIPALQRDYARNFSGPLLSGAGSYDLRRDAARKVTVINFWGAWCGPCQLETPQFQHAYERFRSKNVAFVGIDIKEASRGLPRSFVAKYGITYPIVYDRTGRVAVELGQIPSQAAPFTMVLDDQHRVAAVYLQRITPQELTSVLDALTVES